MGNWRASLPSAYLKASDFEKPALLTIKGFGDEKIGDESRPMSGSVVDLGQFPVIGRNPPKVMTDG